MKRKLPALNALLPFVLILSSCGNSRSINEEYVSRGGIPESFGAYWFKGKAEISSYRLSQARYGQMHRGNAVLVFVTEDFSRIKQRKWEHPDTSSNDFVKVLKMNQMRSFSTGIYSYSTMNSVYTPIDAREGLYSIKATCTVQEWCGQVFSQLNLDANKYIYQIKSYLDVNGDDQRVLQLLIPEDQLWNQIRIDPANLPVGNQTLIPGMSQSRFNQIPITETKAVLAIDDANAEDLPAGLLKQPGIRKYTIEYPEQLRKLEIFFLKNPPYEILGWKDTYPDGPQKKMLTTSAVRYRIIQTDYWNKNSNSDTYLRDSLGLDASVIGNSGFGDRDTVQ